MNNLFDTILNQSLRFEYIIADVTTQRQPINAAWRSLPCMMLAYQKNGTSRLHLTDLPSQAVETNELIAISPGIRHRITLESPAATYYWIHLNYYVLGKLDFFTFAHLPTLIRGKPADRVGDIINNWISSPGDPAADGFVHSHAYKNEIGFRILRELSPLIEPYPENQSKLKYIHQIQPALDRIHQNFITLPDRDDLAGCCNLSTSQFHRVFIRAMNVGPMEYIRNLRIHRAQELLISTDLSIGEIARLSGYDDPFIFSRAFKQNCGLSPNHYRRNFNLTI